MSDERAIGLVLAAGAGTRYGSPKALAADADGPWLDRVATALRDGGCSRVLVALGATLGTTRGTTLGATRGTAEPEVPAWTEVVAVPEWAEGLSATLRAGLVAAAQTDADLLVITPVDVPGLPASAVARVIAAASGPDALVQAAYAGEPGHPVAIGREHWAQLASAVSGDSGARRYLGQHGALAVECGDLWDGADIDRPR